MYILDKVYSNLDKILSPDSSYVRTDIIRRVLIHHFNIDVVMVVGVTDIDDKIIKRVKEVRNLKDIYTPR